MANTSGAYRHQGIKYQSLYMVDQLLYHLVRILMKKPETYEQKSLFHDVDSPTTQAAINLRKRIYNNTINVSGMSPSPIFRSWQIYRIRIRQFRYCIKYI